MSVRIWETKDVRRIVEVLSAIDRPVTEMATPAALEALSRGR
jgi:hypothetical protein